MDCLVLSPGYEPIDHIDWQRAISLVWAGRAEVIHEYADWVVHSVSQVLHVPQVIRFLTGALGRKKSVRYSKENIFARDRGKCAYCGVALTKSKATIDHVLPRSQGGKTEWTNVVVACTTCNSKKDRKTPLQAGMKLRVHPHKPTSLPTELRLSLERKAVPEAWSYYLHSGVTYADD